MLLNSFLNVYPPVASTPVSKNIIESYKNKVPIDLIELWEVHGFGKYGDGMLEIINPDDYRDTLEIWLGKKVPNYIPIAITAFGDLFYYRKLSPKDEDVCLLETHYRNISTCIWSLNDFFNEYLLEDAILSELLRKELFLQCHEKFGTLKSGDSYQFVPALAMGGAEEVEYVETGNAKVHMNLLFQITS